jgi:4a-hydroxytetrahydrobiopterin dehydratase
MGGMDQPGHATHAKLSRLEASEAVTHIGWRLILGEFRTQVLTGSLPLAADIAARAATVPGAQGHLRMDVGADRVILSLQTAAIGWVTGHDVELARNLSTVVNQSGLTTVSGVDGDDASGGDDRGGRSLQVLEIAIDALDAAAIRPFWQAVLGYVDEPGRPGPWEGLVDPLGQGPAIWFQRMDAPRPQRNRIHLDVSVPHDEAESRISAALAAGGRLTYDAKAPAFWVLADAEGNEACVTTWQGRD